MGTPTPGAHQIHRGQSQKQRERGDDFEIEDRLGADAAHVLRAAAAGDACDQGGENQRRDDRADEAKKDRAERAELLRELGREMPSNTPAAMPMKIQAVREMRFIVHPISISGAARRRTSVCGGRISSSE